MSLDFWKTNNGGMNKEFHRASSGRVLLLVTKKFAQRVYLNSNIRGKLFGTPTTAGKFHRAS